MLNVLEIMLLNLTFLIVLLGSLITNYESHMPVALIKFYRYGSFGYKGSAGKLLQSIELPKSYYRHYYVFSSTISVVTFFYMLIVYYGGVDVNEQIKVALYSIFAEREPAVSSKTALTAMGLIALHSARRCYESHFLQVFSSGGKINICHYSTAFVHYTILALAAVGQIPLFCGEPNRDEIQWSDGHTKAILPCVILFLLASYEQYSSNVILANLRKDKKTSSVVTEEHKIPKGRIFEMVSSPHRLCEILLYTAFAILIPTRTMFIMWFWVAANQGMLVRMVISHAAAIVMSAVYVKIQCAVHAHVWYKKTFIDYPANRMALIPYLL